MREAPAKLQAEICRWCAEDPFFYVNTFCWTYDPRKPRKSMPFILWEFQQEALKEILSCVEDGEDLGTPQGGKTARAGEAFGHASNRQRCRFVGAGR